LPPISDPASSRTDEQIRDPRRPRDPPAGGTPQSPCKLAQLDGFSPDDWPDDRELSTAEKQLVAKRFADFAKHLETSIPWAVAEEELEPRHAS